jgi:hypothetical protein
MGRCFIQITVIALFRRTAHRKYAALHKNHFRFDVTECRK